MYLDLFIISLFKKSNAYALFDSNAYALFDWRRVSKTRLNLG